VSHAEVPLPGAAVHGFEEFAADFELTSSLTEELATGQASQAL
jgi:hypothetical protein